jgi:hypothetical protein
MRNAATLIRTKRGDLRRADSVTLNSDPAPLSGYSKSTNIGGRAIGSLRRAEAGGMTMRATGKWVFSNCLAGGLLFFLACAAMAPSTAALANDQVTLRLDWTLEGFHLPFVWALDKGYYAAEGIDAKILEGRGSGNVAQLIGAKTRR